MTIHAAVTGLAFLALFSAVSAQPARVEFDVASVKENRSQQRGGMLRFTPDGGIQARRMRVSIFITVAFELQPYQLVGAPDWSQGTYYDLQAKPVRPVTRERSREMLQSLLLERFRLSFHREMRELDGFRLVRSSDRRLGPNLQRSAFDCEQSPTTLECSEGGITREWMKATGSPIWSLIQMLAGVVGAPVIDETGLQEKYDLELWWSNDLNAAADQTSIFTALREQLGLRLERHRVPVDLFIVDRLERATPD